jgi:hypothetical protein
LKYNEFVKTTDLSDKNAQFYLDGMYEEQGELAGIFKRIRRGDFGEEPKMMLAKSDDVLNRIIFEFPEVFEAIVKELGDRDWYSEGFRNFLGITKEYQDEINQRKLNKREEDGTLMGHGDDR